MGDAAFSGAPPPSLCTPVTYCMQEWLQRIKLVVCDFNHIDTDSSIILVSKNSCMYTGKWDNSPQYGWMNEWRKMIISTMDNLKGNECLNERMNEWMDRSIVWSIKACIST